jgi:hypothetical protein
MKNQSKTIFLICAVFFIGIAIFFSSKKAQNNGAIFQNANINGKITYLGSTNGTSTFKVEDKAEKYFFLSISSPENDFIPFYEIAEIGDSVIKKAKAKELILIKQNGGKEYKYFW